MGWDNCLDDIVSRHNEVSRVEAEIKRGAERGAQLKRSPKSIGESDEQAEGVYRFYCKTASGVSAG